MMHRHLLLLLGLALGGLAMAAQEAPSLASRFDKRAFLLNGKEKLLWQHLKAAAEHLSDKKEALDRLAILEKVTSLVPLPLPLPLPLPEEGFSLVVNFGSDEVQAERIPYRLWLLSLPDGDHLLAHPMAEPEDADRTARVLLLQLPIDSPRRQEAGKAGTAGTHLLVVAKLPHKVGAEPKVRKNEAGYDLVDAEGKVLPLPDNASWNGVLGKFFVALPKRGTEVRPMPMPPMPMPMPTPMMPPMPGKGRIYIAVDWSKHQASPREFPVLLAELQHALRDVKPDHLVEGSVHLHAGKASQLWPLDEIRKDRLHEAILKQVPAHDYQTLDTLDAVLTRTKAGEYRKVYFLTWNPETTIAKDQQGQEQAGLLALAKGMNLVVVQWGRDEVPCLKSLVTQGNYYPLHLPVRGQPRLNFAGLSDATRGNP